MSIELHRQPLNELDKRLHDALNSKGMEKRLALHGIKLWLEKEDFRQAVKMVREIPTAQKCRLMLGTGIRGRLYQEVYVRLNQLEHYEP